MPLRRGECALEAPGGFLQLALEGVNLLGNVDELFFGEHARLGDLMGFAIGAPHGGADFHRYSREPVFLGHGVPTSAAPAIVQRGRGPAKSNAMRERGEEVTGGEKRRESSPLKRQTKVWSVPMSENSGALSCRRWAERRRRTPTARLIFGPAILKHPNDLILLFHL